MVQANRESYALIYFIFFFFYQASPIFFLLDSNEGEQQVSADHMTSVVDR